MNPEPLGPAAAEWVRASVPPAPAPFVARPELSGLGLDPAAGLDQGRGRAGVSGPEGAGVEDPPPPAPWGFDEPPATPAGVPSELGRLGASLLSDALAADPSERPTAFRLLAADAFLTWACEAASGSADPQREIEELVRRISDTRGEGFPGP